MNDVRLLLKLLDFLESIYLCLVQMRPGPPVTIWDWIWCPALASKSDLSIAAWLPNLSQEFLAVATEASNTLQNRIMR